MINNLKKNTEIYFKKNRPVNFKTSLGHKESKTYKIFFGERTCFLCYFRIYYKTRVIKTGWCCGVLMSQNNVFRGRLICLIDFC